MPDGGVETYTYDYVGNITSTTDANGGIITYHYNSMGQVCEIIDQQGHSEFFYYDEEGRQETHIDRNGNVERTLYNRDNHLVYQRAEDKKGRHPVVNRYLYYPDGTLKEAIGGGIAYHYDYTAHGLLQKKSSAGISLLQYAYDKNKNVIQRTDVTGNHTHYTYNALNRLEQVTKDNGELLASYRYTIAGQMEQLCYGNGVKTNYCYREDGKPERLVTITPQGEVLLNYEYAYDGNGNCIKKSGQRYQNEYCYDSKNQLKTASYNGRWETYTYDKVGNRIQKETKEGTEFYTYNTKNQLTSIKTKTGRTDFHYDMQGNLREELGIEKKQYFYDALNRLSTVKTNDLLQKNRYDAERLRHEVEENGVVHRLIFDNGELSAEETKDSKVCYLYGNERVVASKINGAETAYHIQDEAGSTLFLLDETHKIQKTYHYDAFGMVLEESGDTLNRLTYTGQQYDTATGQYYLRARFYNPTLGRFLQEDLYRGDGLNLYAYCKNHPVGYYDPSGYMKCPVSETKTDPGKKNSSEFRQLLNGEEWYKYFREEYGAENVQGSVYNWSQEELQKAMDDIYLAGLNDIINKSKNGKPYRGGPRQTITITQDGKVIISQNSGAVNPKSKIVAKQIFGDNFEGDNYKFVKSGEKYRRPGMSDNFGNHAETRGIYELERTRISTEGVKQVSSHYSCDSCRDTQRKTGVLNYTGYASDNNDIQKRIKY